jgi:NAD(P)-dependent dehydrogenase (short-subunit alcohol dehydrogenase family)
MPRMEIRGSGALVAGGASGLGAATARRLAAAGAAVTIADVDEVRGTALAREIGAGFAVTDVRDEAQVRAAVEQAAAADGGLRIVASCAGVGPAEKVAGSRGPHRLETFERVIAINLIGTFNVLRLAATAMLETGPGAEGERGVVVCTASIAVFEGQVGQIAYAASMTLPAARDLAPSGIRVVTIAPGLFDTPLLATVPDEMRSRLGQSVPFPSRLGRPEEFAQLVEAIVANPMLNGETIRLDGALRMAPR